MKLYMLRRVSLSIIRTNYYLSQLISISTNIASMYKPNVLKFVLEYIALSSATTTAEIAQWV